MTIADNELQMEQTINRFHRNCRIVNVKMKPKPQPQPHPFNIWGWPSSPGFVPQPQIPGVFSLPPMHDTCRGCIGKICGNVACPYRPVATCGVQPLGKEFEAAIYSDVESLFEAQQP